MDRDDDYDRRPTRRDLEYEPAQDDDNAWDEEEWRQEMFRRFRRRGIEVGRNLPTREMERILHQMTPEPAVARVNDAIFGVLGRPVVPATPTLPPVPAYRTPIRSPRSPQTLTPTPPPRSPRRPYSPGTHTPTPTPAPRTPNPAVMAIWDEYDREQAAREPPALAVRSPLDLAQLNRTLTQMPPVPTVRARPISPLAPLPPPMARPASPVVVTDDETTTNHTILMTPELHRLLFPPEGQGPPPFDRAFFQRQPRNVLLYLLDYEGIPIPPRATNERLINVIEQNYTRIFGDPEPPQGPQLPRTEREFLDMVAGLDAAGLRGNMDLVGIPYNPVGTAEEMRQTFWAGIQELNAGRRPAPRPVTTRPRVPPAPRPRPLTTGLVNPGIQVDHLPATEAEFQTMVADLDEAGLKNNMDLLGIRYNPVAPRWSLLRTFWDNIRAIQANMAAAAAPPMMPTVEVPRIPPPPTHLTARQRAAIPRIGFVDRRLLVGRLPRTEAEFRARIAGLDRQQLEYQHELLGLRANPGMSEEELRRNLWAGVQQIRVQLNQPTPTVTFELPPPEGPEPMFLEPIRVTLPAPVVPAVPIPTVVPVPVVPAPTVPFTLTPAAPTLVPLMPAPRVPVPPTIVPAAPTIVPAVPTVNPGQQFLEMNDEQLQAWTQRRITIRELGEYMDLLGIPYRKSMRKADYLAAFLTGVRALRDRAAPAPVRPVSPRPTRPVSPRPTTVAPRPVAEMEQRLHPAEYHQALPTRPTTYQGKDDWWNYSVKHMALAINSRPHRVYLCQGILRTPLDVIMAQPDPAAYLDQLIAQVFAEGPIRSTLNFQDRLLLIWWQYLHNTTVVTRYNTPETQWLLSRDFLTLMDVAGPNYTGPQDHPHVLFALLTHTIVGVDIVNNQAYRERQDQNPRQVLERARFVYDYYRDQIHSASNLSPYEYLAVQAPSPVEPFFNAYDGTNLDLLAPAMGMVIPPGVFADSYFLLNLQSYQPIFSRPQGMLPPPPLTATTPPSTLQRYTDMELLNAYEPTFTTWKNRSELFTKLIQEGGAGSIWRITARHCSNDDRINIMTGGPREKADPEDPVLSYGVPGNYRCYNLSELDGVWREYDDGFRFAVPDYIKGDPMRDFPVQSIRQLVTLLEGVVQSQPVFMPMLAAARAGLVQMSNAAARIQTLRREYLALPGPEQQQVNQFLAWLFQMGMWMRFWKGPGHPYPHVWKEHGGGNDRCDLAARDANVARMFNLRQDVYERIRQVNPALLTWIQTLPRIRYDFRSGEVALGQETIDYVLNKAFEGRFCLADASDRVLQTAYYLARSILDLNNDDEFNLFIANTTGDRRQPPFQPGQTGGTRHIDPDHRHLEPPA